LLLVLLFVQQWDKELDRKNMQMSRNTQGLHMPMKIGMERFAVRQVSSLSWQLQVACLVRHCSRPRH